MPDAPRDEDAAAERSPAPHEPAPPARSPQEAPSDIMAIVDDEDAPGAPALDPRHAYEVLQIRTPLEEFESYVRARIDTLARLGEPEKATLAADALELGRRALARVTGATVPEPKERAQ